MIKGCYRGIKKCQICNMDEKHFHLKKNCADELKLATA